jgi:eukaryotic-like serine/threonine-protein kinase
MTKLELSKSVVIEKNQENWYVGYKNKDYKINESIAIVLEKFKTPRFLEEVLKETLPELFDEVNRPILKNIEELLNGMLQIGILIKDATFETVIPKPVFLLNKTYNQFKINGFISINDAYIQLFKVYNEKLKKYTTLKLFAHKNPETSNDLKLKQNFAIFIQEATISEKIATNNLVCPFIKKDIYQGYHFFEIDFIEGKTLSSSIKSRKILKKNKLEISKQIIEAIAHLHHNNIIHGDIHARNFMLTPDNKVVLIDFGFSHDLKNNSKTQIFNKGGVTHYIPPERVNVHSFSFSKAISTKKSEVYQVGLLIYTLYKGRNPFKKVEETTWREMASDILTRTFEETISGNKNFDLLIRKSLQINPDNRFESCEEMYAEFLKIS